ncbi:MAG: alanine--tRNA ligase [Gammaproteobacteria bacterium]|nr:alanine--tRNA ligase [Gammaproteobacteria bacterium]MCP5136973.1 alanine--tRNA ligase [Gammaproteobacteria bacterium]
MSSSSADIRQQFLDYFHEHGHEIVPSASLVPGNDATLLFTNAGMVQFKDVFTGRESRAVKRATSSQRCVRAGGKHNDLENVGYTARHHTFFEMLGNFSFGDYFKRDAIRFAWEFLTGKMGLPAEKLWVTVYIDDDEAADIWLKDVGVDANRFSRIGDKDGVKYKSDNFWSMGDTGPCGPCTEIFYDHGEDIFGGPPGSPDEDGDRYIEIWNLVFMQYDRAADGEMTLLPHPSVDTGMGLERLAAVMQGVHNNYDIDLFQALIDAAVAATGATDRNDSSLKVIADHIRSCAFLVVDGVLPSNEGRGYVLRRIIRRAIRHGYKLGQSKPFFHSMVAALVATMGEAYPELVKAQSQVERVLRKEEERFAETLDQGMRILEQSLSGLDGKVIPGDVVFRLYDTYGFPADLTADIARERGLGIDGEGFDRHMGEQRQRARAASQFSVAGDADIRIDVATAFTGYTHLEETSSVTALFRGGIAVDVLEEGDEGLLVLDVTPFYAESGGQVGDTGEVVSEDGRATVTDTRKKGDATAQVVRIATGEIRVGDKVQGRVDVARRQAVVLNHSATHLMHAALRAVLGTHVQQKGSLVAPDRLRFDFAHFEPMTGDQIREVERRVNAEIRGNACTTERHMGKDAAIEAGAMALFGEKYGDEVRVITIGDSSTELCGGCHVERAGDIGLFKILSEGGVAAGVRRVEAVTGQNAVDYVEANESRLDRMAGLLKSGRDDVEGKVGQLIERSRKLEKELEALKSKLASSAGSDLAAQAVEIGGIKVLAAKLDGIDPKSLRDTVDQLKNKLGTAAVVLATVGDGKVSLAAGVTKDAITRIKAGDLVNSVALQVGGKGGGRPDMAMAGGNDPANLDAALAAVPDWVRTQLG